MSSLRNALKRITHKERSQPQSRSHLGLLEKKKDYSKRSKDYHQKQARIKNLRKKASERNPDEFYFGMNNARVDSNTGKHSLTHEAYRQKLEDILGVDAIKLMKDQDRNYLRMLIQKDQKRIEKLEATLHFLGDCDGDDDNDSNLKSKKKKHTIFVSTKKDAETFDAAKHFETDPELVKRAFNRPRVQTLVSRAQASGINEDDEDYDSEDESETDKNRNRKKGQGSEEELYQFKNLKKVRKERNKAYMELEQRKERKRILEIALSHLQVEKEVQGKGRKRKIQEATDDGKPAVYKWRRKRQS